MKTGKIKKIVKGRINKRGRHPQIEYMVRWKGFGPEYDEWRKRKELIGTTASMVDEYEQENPVQNL